MKTAIRTVTFLLAILTTAFVQQEDKAFQEAKKFYEQAMEKAQAGQLEEAIKFFDKSITAKSDEYISWYNRGIAKNMLRRYEEALPDFEQTIKIVPNYKKAYLNRGTTKKHLTDYAGAVSDYNIAIQLDPNYADAFYNRGLVYELLGKKDAACGDFNKAMEFGLKRAQAKIDKCNDNSETAISVNAILRLTRTAKDNKYGFTQDNPVKAGTGPEGGPANQEAYFELLRDARGKPIKYKRLGSCCPYKSDHGFSGTAMLDTYQITYLNETGEEKKVVVYISFYDYEEPQILFGFKTVGQK